MNFIKKKACENIVCEMVAIFAIVNSLSSEKCINLQVVFEIYTFKITATSPWDNEWDRDFVKSRDKTLYYWVLKLFEASKLSYQDENPRCKKTIFPLKHV